MEQYKIYLVDQCGKMIYWDTCRRSVLRLDCNFEHSESGEKIGDWEKQTWNNFICAVLRSRIFDKWFYSSEIYGLFEINQLKIEEKKNITLITLNFMWITTNNNIIEVCDSEKQKSDI